MIKVLSSNYFIKFRSSCLSKAMVLFFLALIVSILAWRSLNYISGTEVRKDSGVFASGGFFLLEGKVLYKDFWDHKPPVVHFLNAAAIALGGKNINSIRMMERCFAVFGGVSLFFIIYLLFKNAPLSFFASIFYIMLFYRPTVFDGGNLTEEYGEIFVIGGILFAVLSNETRRFLFTSIFISGMFFATAFFTKEPFLLSAIPWFIYLVLYKDYNRINVLKRASIFISGAVLVFAAILFYLIINDAFKNWIDVLSFNRVYVSVFSSNLTMLSRVSENCKWAYELLFRAACAVSLYALIGLISGFHWSFVKKYKYLYLVVVSFFVADFCGTMIAAKGLGHYYLQLVTSYVLLGTIGVEFLLNIFRKSRFAQAGFILAIILLSFNSDYKSMYRGYKKHLMMPAEKVPFDSIVDYIKANSSKKEETIWITNGAFSKYYIESERLSPTKYFYIIDHLFADTYLSTAEEKINGIKDDLKRNPPRFIITGFDDVKVVEKAGIQDWISENYYKLPVSAGSPAELLVLKSAPVILLRGQ